MVQQVRGKILVLIALLAVFSSLALAKQSELVLSVNEENKIFVERLFDDDGSIGLVDLCVLTLSSASSGGSVPTQSECYQFENVIEGQILNIDVDQTFVLAGPVPYPVLSQIKEIYLQIDIGGGGGGGGGGSGNTCGDRTCGSAEDCLTCSIDCGRCRYCGDRICEPAIGESCTNCSRDCGTCPPVCGDNVCNTTENCVSCSQDCPVCVSGTAAAYYNFLDIDGKITNAKFLVFSTKPKYAPVLSDETQNSGANIIEQKTLTPLLSEDKKTFIIKASVKIDPAFSPQSVNFRWRINQETLFNSLPLTNSNGEWTAEIGPFNQPIMLSSSVQVDIGGGILHEEIFRPRLLHLITRNQDGTCSSATFRPPTGYTTSSANSSQALFQQTITTQPGWPESVSRVKLSPNCAFNPTTNTIQCSADSFFVERIRDETSGSLEETLADEGDIDFLNVFVVKNETASDGTIKPAVYKKACYNIEENSIIDARIGGTRGTICANNSTVNCCESTVKDDSSNLLGSIVITDPSGSEIFYNFMDYDDSVGNLNLLLPLNPQELGDATPLLPEDKRLFIEKVDMEIVPSEDCSTFKIKFKTTVPADKNIQRVFLRYGFGDYSLKEESTEHARLSGPENAVAPNSGLVLELQESGESFEGEIGPFSTAFDLFSRVYAEGADGALGSFQNFFSWFGLQPPEEAKPLEELCGNKIDDNGDGNIDEGCVVLPDLMFVGESSIPGFVTVGEQMQVNATVKNAGVSNTTAFQIGFYINDNLIDFVPVEGMQAGEEKQINFSLEDTASFLGLNMAKILIDSTNSIPELDEANNVIEKGVGIGFNSFNVILNYNNTELLGDAREYRVIKREGGKPEPNVLTVITFPDGRKQELSTNESGINNFQLTQSGLYLLFASKDKFDAFEGSFVIPKITLLNLAQSYNVGDTVLFIVQTEEGKKIKDAIVQIKDSANRITELRTDLDGKVEFRPIVGGPHGLTISRNGVPIMVTGFLSIGAIESVFGGGGIEQILFGSTIKNPPQFIFLLLLTFGAAFIAFSRSKLLFKAGPKSTREEQLENVARLLIAVAFFLVPFQAANFLGYNVGIAIVIIEALAAFMYENYRKGKKKRPPIKV